MARPWLKHVRRHMQSDVQKSSGFNPHVVIPASSFSFTFKCLFSQRLDEEEERKKRSRAPQQKPLPPRTTVVDVAHPQNQGALALTATARVSHRVLPDTINIQMYPPVYNDLTGEVCMCFVCVCVFLYWCVRWTETVCQMLQSCMFLKGPIWHTGLHYISSG